VRLTPAAVGVAAGALVVAGGAVLVLRDAETPGPKPLTAPPSSTTSTTAPPWEAVPRALDGVTDPEGLAVTIASAEGALRAPGAPPEAIAGWAPVQQAAYRLLARNPDWDAQITAALGEDLGPLAVANAQAFRELWALTTPREALPDWAIVEPPAADELLGHYRAAEEKFGVGWEHLAAIHLIETRMGRIRGASSAGARGPMQFIPATWAAYGEGDIEDPGDAIAAAARYLVAHGAPGDMPRALFAYNHSDHYVAAVEIYARIMQDEPRAYLGYHAWDVYYRLTTGDVVLPIGWTLEQGVPR